MKKYKSTTYSKTVGLIILTHLVFFLIIITMYFRVDSQEKIMKLQTEFLQTKNDVFIHELELLFSSSKNSFLVLAVLIFLNLALYVIYVNKKIFLPIKLITSALETGSKRCIKLLKTIPGEFEYIGNLFQDNNNHKFELVSAKTKAEESERLKSTFLENLSHEIRTPMNAIIGFTDIMLTSQLTDDEKSEYLQIIHKSGTSLVSIIEDLIEMSKIDTNQIVPNYVDINLDKCLKELYNTIKVSIPKSKKIDFILLKVELL